MGDPSARGLRMTDTAAGSAPDGQAPALELRQVAAAYGHIQALKGVSLRIEAGEIVTLIGANGAGKSTTLRAISGLLHPRSGEILMHGTRIDRLPPHRIVELGIAQSPEGRHVFPRMTVAENLQLGAFARRDRGAISNDRDRVLQLFPRLGQRIAQPAGTL